MITVDRGTAIAAATPPVGGEGCAVADSDDHRLPEPRRLTKLNFLLLVLGEVFKPIHRGLQMALDLCVVGRPLCIR